MPLFYAFYFILLFLVVLLDGLGLLAGPFGSIQMLRVDSRRLGTLCCLLLSACLCHVKFYKCCTARQTSFLSDNCSFYIILLDIKHQMMMIATKQVAYRSHLDPATPSKIKAVFNAQRAFSVANRKHIASFTITISRSTV